jgi:hypothetical protein
MDIDWVMELSVYDIQRVTEQKTKQLINNPKRTLLVTLLQRQHSINVRSLVTEHSRAINKRLLDEHAYKVYSKEITPMFYEVEPCFMVIGTSAGNDVTNDVTNDEQIHEYKHYQVLDS